MSTDSLAAPDRPPVLFDIQGTQTPTSGARGIARHVLGLATALETFRPGWVKRYLLNPALPVAARTEGLATSAQVVPATTPLDGDECVLHVASPFEFRPLDEVWPKAIRLAGLRLVMTVHDLIPAVISHYYLKDPRSRRVYKTRLEFVRAADRLLVPSQATARDCRALLGLSPEKIVVTGLAPEAQFRAAVDRAAALHDVRAAVPGLRPGFVLCPSWAEWRKNLHLLLAGYSRLPAELRAQHQLVVTGHGSAADQDRVRKRAQYLGIAGDVLLAGFLADDLLVKLYQSTKLCVFPSYYEGYGLPVAEAIACGAATIVSDTSSLPELVSLAEARFKPGDLWSIATVIERALTDEGFHRQLREMRLGPEHKWEEVASRTVEVYREMIDRGLRLRRTRPQVAYVAPSAGSGEGFERLLARLRRSCDVDVYGEGAFRLAALERIGGLRGGYDRVLYPSTWPPAS